MYCHPAYLTYMQSTSWETGWMKHWNQDCREKYQLPQICRWHHPYGRKWRTKEPLDESERGERKSWLKAQHLENEDHGIWSITSWKINGETMETVRNFIFGGSKITADGDCSHEIKRRLLLGRKAMTNLESILKCRNITLSTKVHLVNAMVFPVVMYGCESWTIKKAEHWRIESFDLWCWRRLFWVHWLTVKDPGAGKDWREKGTTEDEMAGWQHRLNGHEFEQAPWACDGQGSLARFSPCGHK